VHETCFVRPSDLTRVRPPARSALAALRIARALALLAALATASTTGCASRPTDDANDDALIGGTDTRADALPSIVTVARVPKTGLPAAAIALPGACTAARIGPRELLLAAHCVLDPATVSSIWKPGDAIAMLHDPSKGWREEHVASVEVHPTWKAACEESYCAASIVTARLDAPDVAVIVLERDLDGAGIAIAAVDEAPLEDGDEVILTGYGCTAGVHLADDRDRIALASKPSRIEPLAVVVHAGSPVTATSAPTAAGNYNFTLGPGATHASAGLCPGDSGGPLDRKKGDALVVVGVNANYTLYDDANDPAGLPVTNWHTRLDTASRHDVAGWLRELHAEAR
jgi:secreted trypsin-like serine protease